MKLSLRLLVPTLAIVLAAGAAALFSSSPAQAQTPGTCAGGVICVESVAFTSPGPYMVGNTIEMTFMFSGDIVAQDTNSDGTPNPATTTIELKVFDTGPGTTTRRFMAVHPIVATNELVFKYEVLAADPDKGVVTVDQNAWADTGSTLPAGSALVAADGSSNLNMMHNRLSAYDVSGHLIDKTAPSFDSGSTSAANISKTGGTISVTITFNEPVKVAGMPSLILKVGDANRTATYTSGDGTDEVVFTYITVKGDDGAVSVPDDSISLNGGSITDLAGNPAARAFTGVTVIGENTVVTDDTEPSVTYRPPSSLTVGIRIRTISPRTSDTDIASYTITEGRLPRTLSFNTETGQITGRPTRATAGPTRLTIKVCDGEPDPNCADVTLTLPAILEDEDDAVPASSAAALPDVAPLDLSSVTVGDAAPSTALQITLAATGGALLLGGVGMVAVRRQRARAKIRR